MLPVGSAFERIQAKDLPMNRRFRRAVAQDGLNGFMNQMACGNYGLLPCRGIRLAIFRLNPPAHQEDVSGRHGDSRE